MNRSNHCLRLFAVILGTAAFGQTSIRITGQVLDRLNGSIATARVALKIAGSKQTVATATTDQSGRFTFSAVSPGQYELHFQSPGFALKEMGITADKNTDVASIVMEVAPIEGPAGPPYYVAPLAKTLEGDHAAQQQPTRKAVPRFEDFSVPTPIPFRRGPTYVAKNVRDFEKEILQVAKDGPDFAGHFVVEQFTCGSGCTSFLIVNVGTYQVFGSDFNVTNSFFPEGHEDGPELIYRPDSRLLIVNGAIENLSHTKGEVDGPYGHFYFLWDGRSLKQIHSVIPAAPKVPH